MNNRSVSYLPKPLAFFCFGLSLFAANAAFAQSNVSGSINGIVANGSTVVVENLGTGEKRSTTASANGAFRVGALPPGDYKVSYNDGGSNATQTKEVSVSIGSNTIVGGAAVQMAKFVVGGASINPVDMSNTETVSVFSEKQINQLPVARNPTAIALLAPGTTLGDTAFGNFASFGGASVAENAYFVNGFNISNFRNGLDPATVPFEFYHQFEIKTGAYSAEFGRSTGGVINATTKSGTNEYHAGANIYFQPDAGRSNSPNVFYANNSGKIVPLIYNTADYLESNQANIYASGPLWKNKVFFYGLYQLRDTKTEDVVTSGTQHLSTSSDDPFWGIKVDIKPFSGHSLEYTGYRDEARTTSVQAPYDLATKQKTPGGVGESTFSDRGGTTHIGRYTFTSDKLMISALYGESTQNLTTGGFSDHLPAIHDFRSGALLYVQGNPAVAVSNASDRRKAKRLDAEYSLDLFGATHRFRAGFDREDNLSDSMLFYSGGRYLRYYSIPANGIINGAVVPAGTTAAVRTRIYNNGGSFAVNSGAEYLEDNVTMMNNRLNLRLGLRRESFENLDSVQKPFIKVDNQLAPRFGLSFDLFGDRKTKLFADFGRYHLPIASNTNVTLAGAELFTEEWNVLSSVGADGKNPVLGAAVGAKGIYAAGIVRDRRELVDQNIKPMYQDELVLGIQHALTKSISVGMRAVNRKIDGTAIDDMIVDHALTAWGKANGFPNFSVTGGTARVLGTPGRPISMSWDFNGNGTLDANENATLSATQLGYSAAVRTYYALEFFGEKVWDGKWNAQFSYTWSHLYGNYEGWVSSDLGENDAGITTMFDTPALTRNTYGNGANDRRHQFKAFGSYAITPQLTTSVNLLLASGRPINKFGTYNDPITGSIYGASYLLVPRGSAGNTGWVFQTDLAFTYRPKAAWVDKRLSIQLDIFNILNRKTATEVVETFQNAAGGVEMSYGLPSAWQQPRYMRLSVRFDY